MLARDWLEVETGAFDILGELPSFHTLSFPLGFRHKDYTFLTDCKKPKKPDLSYTVFRDCSLLSQLSGLRSACLPRKKQPIHAEELDGLKAG